MTHHSEDKKARPPHKWRFFRAGGFDQVRLDAAEDLRRLGELDPKLWVALSCPTKGLEFDARTLDLIDTDRDGRIRVPEILGAVRWACSVLRDPADLTKGAAALPLSAIDDSTDEGKQLVASARQVLVNLGKEGAEEIGLDDVADTARIFAQTRFNGDGIVPADAAEDEATGKLIGEIVACLGGEADRSGKPGVSRAALECFFQEAEACAAWWGKGEGDAAVLPLGDATPAAADAVAAVRGKVDDYFLRCRLAAFDPRAAGALNRSETDYAALAAKDLSAAGDDMAALPLARVEAGKALPLARGLNPAWVGRVAALRTLAVEPALGAREELDEAAWEELKARFAAHDAWRAARPASPLAAVPPERLREILAGGGRQAVEALIAQDEALAPEADAIASVERLVRYHRDLHTLLDNFVSFRDFYTHRAKAVFQAGTLYLDGRSCDLCVRVEDVGKHSALATLSRTYLAYCECTRRGSAEKMHVAAAFTGGDADFLSAGRNGVFYDRKGQDWDATVVKLVENPISVRQAFWAPYKRIGKMIGEQVEKLASAREKAVQDQSATAVAAAGQKVGAPTPAPAAFDIGKFVGIFAAIGLALGAIGSAVAALATGFLGLRWWQMPLAPVGMLLLISGPAVVIAALKLRLRNLGPILDGNGWAVNARAKINIPFGGALTAVAKLPRGSERSLADPYAQKRFPWGLLLLLAALAAAAGALWQRGYLGRWLGF